jgi:hypothetical protein
VTQQTKASIGAKLLSAAPVLPAQDIDETVSFFEQNLGFRARHQEDGYGIVVRDAVEVHFWQCSDRNIAENSSCRLSVIGIDELYTEAAGREIVHPKAHLETKPWGLREFAVVDINGNLIWFAERVGQSPATSQE